MSGAQGGFGFAPSMGAPRRASKLVRIANAGLFWMVDAGSAWVPFLPGLRGADEAKQEAARRFAASVVRVVSAAEVGR